jgi:alpha-galactosidase
MWGIIPAAGLFAAIAVVGPANWAGAAAAGAAGGTISTDDISATITVVNDRPALSSLRSRADGREWAMAQAVPMGLIESAQVEQRELPLHWRFVRDAASDRQATHDFQFGCDEPSLELHSIWSGHRGPGPIEHQIIILNRGKAPVLLPVQPSLEMTLQAPAGHALEQWWVEKGAGTPTPQGVHRVALAPGNEASISCWPSGRDNPRDAIPWMTVQDVEAKQGWYAGIELTARTRIDVTPGEAVGESRPITVRIGLQEDAANRYFTRVGPGERFEAPKVFIGCYGGDVDDGANRLRKWVRTNLTPATRDPHYPLLVNNSWGSGMAVDERLARKMIDESAELGLELFHIDAGWFRTVGDWRPSEKKFPRGLGPVADYAHQKGLKFGLWVGWTQGGDQVDPTGEHRIMSPFDLTMADWFYQDFPKNWKAGEFTGATACLGDPKVVDWCLDQLRAIVKEDKLDLLEHDQTMVLDGCAQHGHLHTPSRVDVGYRSALGYYQVYDTLRAENPNLLFENCVNGGHMVDYGAVRRCHYISITDTYDPLSNRRAFYDASYALPPAMCECYIENVAVRSVAQFKAMLRSGMMGWCTIMTDTSKWTPEQHAAAKQQFALYKSKLRPLIREADLYHVSERPDGARWDGIEYFDPRTGDGAVFAFRGKGQEEAHTFKLKGLEVGARYEVSFEDGSGAKQVRSGDELMRGGLEVKLAEAQSSEIVYLDRQ